jgi:hypothetical protein
MKSATAMAMTKAATTPVFWRDEALPFIEGRSIADGRKVCYASIRTIPFRSARSRVARD